ncbi:MAG: cytochrome c family protein [Sphingomicrobium sp.]|nr:cytochrome c family protein [Sphingomonadales bacterium]
MKDRNNTIAGWVLFAGIVALGGSVVTGEVYNHERPEKMGYPIAGVVEEGAGAAVAEKPIEFYLASADAAKGADVFKKCAACHNADKGGPNALGPNLWGVIGEPIGKGANGFAFSDALSKIGGNWDWTSLNHWLASPKAMAPGTKMTFAGLSNPQDRANVIAFLNTKSDALKPLPAAPKDAGASGASAAAGAPGAADAKGQAEMKNGAGAQKAANQPVLDEQQAAKGGSKNVGGPAATKVTGPGGADKIKGP